MVGGEQNIPLLESTGEGEEGELGLVKRVWEESKKLWPIVGPAMITRLSNYSMNIITQGCAGHLGDLELASISIAITVILGFNMGFLLGMASALETLCGQAYGAKRLHMLGIYMQRSWIVLFIVGVMLLPMYLFTTPILEMIGEPPELARQAGQVSVRFIPVHLAFVFLFPMNRFLQSQLKNNTNAVIAFGVLVVHGFISWIFVHKLRLGLVATVYTFNFSWWLVVLCQLAYVSCGGCPHSWKGFSMEAFSGLWDFTKLSVSSGVMLCLETWYYRILILLAGNLKNAEIAVDALAVCMNINSWEMMIHMAFFAATGVRVSNELGAGNGKSARLATIVSVMTSMTIGLFFWVLIMVLHDKFALIFTSSIIVLKAVDRLSILLAFTILLNSVQPILSGVAVGSGWQGIVAYINIGTYYIIGIPLGVLMGWVLHLGVLGIWAGMIGGTTVQTLILVFLVIRCNWERECMMAATRVQRYSTPSQSSKHNASEKVKETL